MATLTKEKISNRLKANIEDIFGISDIKLGFSIIPLKHCIVQAYAKDNRTASQYLRELALKNHDSYAQSLQQPQLKDIIDFNKIFNIVKPCRLVLTLFRHLIIKGIDKLFPSEEELFPSSFATSSKTAIILKSLVNLIFVPFEAPLKIVERAVDTTFKIIEFVNNIMVRASGLGIKAFASLIRAGVDFLPKSIVPKPTNANSSAKHIYQKLVSQNEQSSINTQQENLSGQTIPEKASSYSANSMLNKGDDNTIKTFPPVDNMNNTSSFFSQITKKGNENPNIQDGASVGPTNAS